MQMSEPKLGPEADHALEQVLGYLNYSNGAHDPQTFRSLNRIAELLPPKASFPQQLARLLTERLEQLRQSSKAFADAEQAAGVLDALFDGLFSAYREFHRDLLDHHRDEDLFRPFLVGRMMEALLSQGGPWDEKSRLVEGAISRLNDYIGYRPVAALQSQRIEPYDHEWVRPLPVYIRDVGVEHGPAREVIERAIELLRTTDEDLLRTACFNLDVVDEIAIDPRAYDFDHPANKRPNHHFGMWDPHAIDNSGRYCRYIIQQVTLDALLARLRDTSAPLEELKFEAACVLAGTVLMSSAVCGGGPGAFASTMTLGHLLPPVAAMRDEFYRRLINGMDGPHRQRLTEEAQAYHQPFGGARQQLNAELARSRATQLAHIHLAKLYARMGFLEAADRQASVVHVASARIHCDLDCMVTTANRMLDEGKLELASETPAKAFDLLKRGIRCGAIVDPWNMLGFDAHFSLFPAIENSIHDHRIDDLVGVVERVMALYSRIWSDAAAGDHPQIETRIDQEFAQFTDWWRKYAAHEVESVDCPDPLDVYHSAKHVAEALKHWHRGGAAAGDVRFWAPHAELFDSPKGYALVIESLLQRGDFISSMALLNHWLGQVDRIPLEQGESSFHELTEFWIESLLRSEEPEVVEQRWNLLQKFFDHLEANAEEYWRAPRFELSRRGRNEAAEPFADEDEEEDELFGAAYEGVVYRDSTDDGEEGSVFEFGESEDEDEFSREAVRLSRRLAFLGNLARLWKNVAVRGVWREADEEKSKETLMRWVRQAVANRSDLLDLLDEVRLHSIGSMQVDHEALLEYDRRRLTKESILDRIIGTCVETLDAARLLAAAALGTEIESIPELADLNGEMLSAVRICSAIFRQDREMVREEMPQLFETLRERPLLYVPLSKGGDPSLIVTARMRQQVIYDLLVWLPRLGLINETCELLETARLMERDVSVGPGAVTEFDELFAAGYRALVEALVYCERDDDEEFEATLIELLERLTESLLVCWLAHSRTLRLSVLEKVADNRPWTRLVEFIQKYGDELFTQRFLNLGNIRAILHQGVDEWLEGLMEYGADDEPAKLLGDLGGDPKKIHRAVDILTLILEAIIENYGEYRDYNSTTTQSDRGEMLYSLLDFLRLRTKYDRVAWNLRPVVWAHDVLIRHELATAAKNWREALTERVNEEAELHLSRLRELQKKYAMRMPTIADRLAERFVKPLRIDSMRNLVPTALKEAEEYGEQAPSFLLLEAEAEGLVRAPSGVGLDAPPWLIALEEEVEIATRPQHLAAEDIAEHAGFPRVRLTVEDARQQLEEACRRNDLSSVTSIEDVDESADAEPATDDGDAEEDQQNDAE